MAKRQEKSPVRVTAALKAGPNRIAGVLKAALPDDTIVDVSPSGVRDNLHVLVVSRTLDRMTEPKKQKYLWDLLEAAVKKGSLAQAELDRVSLILPVGINELRR